MPPALKRMRHSRFESQNGTATGSSTLAEHDGGDRRDVLIALDNINQAEADDMNRSEPKEIVHALSNDNAALRVEPASDSLQSVNLIAASADAEGGASTVNTDSSSNKASSTSYDNLHEALKIHSQVENLIPRGRRYRRLIGIPPDDCDEDCMPQSPDITAAILHPHEFNRTLKAELDDLNVMNIIFENVKDDLYLLRSKVLDHQIDAVKSGDSELLDPFILQALDADEYSRLQCMSKDFVRRQAVIHQFELEYLANESECREELESYKQQCEQILKEHMLSLEYETLRPLLTRAIVAGHKRATEVMVANARAQQQQTVGGVGGGGIKWNKTYYGTQRVAAKLRLRRAKLDLDSMLRHALHEKYFGQRSYLLERELDAMNELLLDQIIEALGEQSDTVELQRMLKSTNKRYNALARCYGRPETRTPRSSPRRRKRIVAAEAKSGRVDSTTTTAKTGQSTSTSDTDDAAAVAAGNDDDAVDANCSEDQLNSKIIDSWCRLVMERTFGSDPQSTDWRNEFDKLQQHALSVHRKKPPTSKDAVRST